MTIKKTTDPLVGKFAHIMNSEKKPENQLGIVAALPGDHYLCQFYSWMDGTPNHCKIFHITEMKEWRIYTDEDFWREEGDRLTKIN